LARSESVWERRSSIVATSYFVRQGDVDATFRIAEMLLGDNHDLIHKAAGGCLLSPITPYRWGLHVVLVHKDSGIWISPAPIGHA